MIGYLRGKVLLSDDDYLVLDCGGVGYEIHPTSAVVREAERAGSSEFEVIVHTLVRQEEIALFGFASQEERSLFRLLLEASGVGPRIALHIVSQLGQEGFVDAVLTGNPLPFTKVKGVGRKTAERIIIELKEKVSKLYAGEAKKREFSQARASPVMLEAQEALVRLGFKRQEVADVLAALGCPRDAGVDTIIREALMRLR